MKVSKTEVKTGFFENLKAENLSQQTSTTRNDKGTPPGKRKIPNEKVDLHKRKKSTQNDNYMSKYITILII